VRQPDFLDMLINTDNLADLTKTERKRLLDKLARMGEESACQQPEQRQRAEIARIKNRLRKKGKPTPKERVKPMQLPDKQFLQKT